ncbi:MAG: hypothetical protein CMI55_00885 [Parcubacteria group bacterium]|nr:hypothetical protein [Parcubacteria group bacterium]
MREFFRDTIASLSKTLAHPRKSKKYRDLENALEAVNEILEKESVVGGLSTEQRERLDQLFNVLQVIEAILNIDQNIHGRFRALAQQFHPDANPGDAMAQEHFKEASTAYRKLTDANEEKRKAFAMNLVFGQRTELWTNEMKEVAEPIAMQLAPVFALEKPMRGETVPCDECNGSGNVAVQKQDDYFPVPVVCEGCDGAGAVPKSVHELRKALESLEQEDGKEYETERDDEYDEEDYEYEDDEYDDDEDY